jgi:hypothetical protein
VTASESPPASLQEVTARMRRRNQEHARHLGESPRDGFVPPERLAGVIRHQNDRIRERMGAPSVVLEEQREIARREMLGAITKLIPAFEDPDVDVEVIRSSGQILFPAIVEYLRGEEQLTRSVTRSETRSSIESMLSAVARLDAYRGVPSKMGS